MEFIGFPNHREHEMERFRRENTKLLIMLKTFFSFGLVMSAVVAISQLTTVAKSKEAKPDYTLDCEHIITAGKPLGIFTSTMDCMTHAPKCPCRHLIFI